MEAITREEKIMSGEKLTPITRKEMFLAKAAGQNIKTPEPITREEMFLSNVSGGGTSGTTDERFKQLVERTITDISDDTVTSVGDYTFQFCSQLTSVNLPLATSVGDSAFNSCVQLSCVIFRTETICALANASAFKNTPFASGNAGGTFIFPRSLTTEYPNATNWSSVISGNANNRVLALEDYTVDGTITGEIDWDKLNGGTTA